MAVITVPMSFFDVAIVHTCTPGAVLGKHLVVWADLANLVL